MTRQIAGFFIIITIVLLFGNVYAADSAGGHQETHSVNVTIPEIIRLEVKADEVVFDLTDVKDISSFPFYYIPATPIYAEIKIFSNVDREWQLKIKGETSGGLPVENIEWSLDGKNWHALRAQEEIVANGAFTKGWQGIKVYYRLVLTGGEYAGRYKLQVNYGLTAI